MVHESRTATILSTSELNELAKIVYAKARALKVIEPKVYVEPVGKNTDEGMIPEKRKGQVNCYLWGKKVNKGYIGLNMFIINGYTEGLFDNEDYVKVHYEIFPSAKHNSYNSKIFDTFVKEQNTLKASNYSATKKAVMKVLTKFSRRR